MDRLTRLMVIVMTALCASVGLGAERGVTTVELRATVRLVHGEEITLGRLARLSGDQAGALEGLAVACEEPGAGRWVRVDAADVRAAIEASDARAGSVVVSGSGVSVTRMAARELAAVEPRIEAPAEPVVTVRDHVSAWVRARFDSREEDIRLSYDERDDGLLGMPSAGRAVEVSQVGVSGRFSVRVTVYEGETLVETRALRVGVQVRRNGAVATQEMRRGGRVGAGQFETRAVWVDPTRPCADPASLTGQALRKTVTPGAIILASDVEPPVLVRRGQDVSVRTVRGTVVVTSIARARHDACEGEMVELEAKDRSGARFSGRVAGPGRVVIHHQEPSREALP